MSRHPGYTNERVTIPATMRVFYRERSPGRIEWAKLSFAPQDDPNRPAECRENEGNMKTLDLESLHLEKGSHSKSSGEYCIMEAVAYIAGEPFSASPKCASPVISAFLRSYNDSVSDDVRQTLKQYIPRLIGTRGSDALEERRSLIATDWLVRVHTPAWLRLAGLTVHADALASLPEITSLAQIPSIKGPIEAARVDADAAGDAAGDAAKAAAWVAARDAAGAAAGDAAKAAAWVAAWAAARVAARVAVWDAWDAARDAAWAAAWAAARVAAGVAARVAARDAAGAALKPTVVELQTTVPDLIDRLLSCELPPA